MFKIPDLKSVQSAIGRGLPFLSTQEDAQLSFKAGPNGIKRLSSDEVIPLSDVDYWSQYYKLFDSATNVYSLISVQDIRQALQTSPKNVTTLLHSLSHHLFTLLPSDLFPSSSNRTLQGQDSTKEVLNCLRVLGRVLVVIFEADSEERENAAIYGTTNTGRRFAEEVLWSRKPVAREEQAAETPEVEKETENQFTIEDSDSDDDEITAGVKAFKSSTSASAATHVAAGSSDPLSQSAGPENKESADEKMMPSLADRLFSCTVDLLFCAGFTLPEGVRGSEGRGDKINYVIWDKGVGSTVSVGTTAELDRNKTEVLRFLLILLSTTIYTSPHLLPTTPNPPLQQLTHHLERRLVLSLLCSFLNTALTDPRASAGLGGQIPYNHLLSSAGEDRRALVRLSLMVLLVALDNWGGSGMEEVSAPSNGDVKDGNAFCYFVSKLHRKDDLAFILDGILGVLAEQVSLGGNFLPGSKKTVPYVLETFMLLWKVIDLNKRFRNYVFESGKTVDLIAYVLLCCLENKDDPAHHGLLRMLSYILQTLSADRAFGIAMNQPIKLNVPAKWAVPGSAADFLIVSVYSIATTSGLNPLFPALTITIVNIAPYVQNIGVQASTRLLQLFNRFSTPSFLLADEGHPRLVYYLLETFNAILYHQLSENPHVVYAILRSHQDFQALATFTLMSGLREIQRRAKQRQALAEKRDGTGEAEPNLPAEKAALLRRESEGPAPTSPQIPAAADSTQELVTPGEVASDPLADTDPLSEKARGKMRARSESISSIAQLDIANGVNPALEALAAAGIGPNNYVPTQEWVSSWQKGLPLDPVLVAISELLPKVQALQDPKSSGPSTAVIGLLHSASLTDVLPPSGPVQPRRFQWSLASHIWLTSLLWGDIYVAGLTASGGWINTSVKLFGVRQAPVKGAREQVGRVLKMIGVV